MKRAGAARARASSRGRLDPALLEQLPRALRGANYAMFRRLRGSLAREGLPFSRFLVLRLLALRGPTTSKALAKAMGVTTANMPGLIDRLEADGLVTRRQNANDRREILVSVTRTGRQTLARLKESAGTEMIAAFEGWTNAELRTLLDALRRITDGRPGGDLIELNMIR